MKHILEKAGILSLSLLLVSTYSVSTAIPGMIDFYDGYSRSQVEQLISISSIAVTLVIILNPLISKTINERKSIVIGLLLLTLGGIAPVFTQEYAFVFIARLIHGAGIGLMNVYAIDIINERFEGDERSAMLGYRGSSEIVGTVILTLSAGWILGAGLDWQYCFLIYSFGFVVLLIYFLFVPNTEKKQKIYNEKTAENKYKGKDLIKGYIVCGLLGALFVGINTCNTMRIPSLVIEKGIGTDAQSSLISSVMMVTGIIAGIAFGKLLQISKGYLQKIGLFVLGIGLIIMAGAGNMFILGLGAIVTGFAFNILITTVFEGISEQFPPYAITMATTCTLVGCNLGSFASSYVLNIIDLINNKMSMSFIVFAVLAVIVGIFTSKKSAVS